MFNFKWTVFAVPSKLGPRSILLRSTEPDVVSLGPAGNDRFRETQCGRWRIVLAMSGDDMRLVSAWVTVST